MSRCLNNLVIIALASHEKALGTSCVLPNCQSYLCERVVSEKPLKLWSQINLRRPPWS